MKRPLLEFVIVAGLFVCWNTRALTPAPTPAPAPVTAVAPTVVPALPVAAPAASKPMVSAVPSSPAVLDLHRRYALGMIETGNNDGEIGGLGEVSRYQIMPSVWRQYSSSRRYQDPGTSLEVAQRHWTALYAGFKQHTHREPTDFDMYVLWNTRYGYYASRGFDPSRLNPVVRDRAQRFVNLTQREQT
jgi:hypothetical protein